MEKRIPISRDGQSGFDHEALTEAISELCERFDFLSYNYLGNSILGRGIPLLTVGKGAREVLYIGAHHGMEWITSLVLTRFLWELCDAYAKGHKPYRISLELLLQTHTLHVVPMLNPDGVEYQIHGVKEDNPLFDRLKTMNQGSESFSKWQANARGVDLNHNYDAGFSEYQIWQCKNGIGGGAPTRFCGETPESEPEVASLCNFIRFHDRLRGVMTLHTQGREIYYKSDGKAPRKASAVAQRLASLCGYRLAEASGPAAYGGLTDWCVRKLDLPSFTLECGKGVNPLPLSAFFSIYRDLRQALFCFPLLL